MPRRGQISKRDVLPDPLYNSKLVTKLINNIMYDGKKGVAQKIVYDAFAIVETKSGKNPLEAFQAALDNIMPKLEVKARRVGGSTYQVPMDVRQSIPELAAKEQWLIDLQRKYWTRSTTQVRLLRRKKILTKWLKLTRLLHISDGKEFLNGKRISA